MTVSSGPVPMLVWPASRATNGPFGAVGLGAFFFFGFFFLWCAAEATGP